MNEGLGELRVSKTLFYIAIAVLTSEMELVSDCLKQKIENK